MRNTFSSEVKQLQREEEVPQNDRHAAQTLFHLHLWTAAAGRLRCCFLLKLLYLIMLRNTDSMWGAQQTGSLCSVRVEEVAVVWILFYSPHVCLTGKVTACQQAVTKRLRDFPPSPEPTDCISREHTGLWRAATYPLGPPRVPASCNTCARGKPGSPLVIPLNPEWGMNGRPPSCRGGNSFKWVWSIGRHGWNLFKEIFHWTSGHLDLLVALQEESLAFTHWRTWASVPNVRSIELSTSTDASPKSRPSNTNSPIIAQHRLLLLVSMLVCFPAESFDIPDLSLKHIL